MKDMANDIQEKKIDLLAEFRKYDG